MKISFPLLLILAILLGACKNEPADSGHQGHEGHKANQAQVNSNFKTYDDLDASGKELYARVMGIHDSIMPQMSTIMRYQGLIQPVFRAQKAKQIENDSMTNDMRNAMSNLKRAEHAMGDWMHDFDEAFDTVPKPYKKQFLEANLDRIIHVQNLMSEGLYIGEQTVNKYKLSDAKQ